MPMRYPATLLALARTACQAGAQMVSGSKMPGFHETFGLDPQAKDPPIKVTFVTSSVPASVLWTGEQASFTFQLLNLTQEAIDRAGRINLIAYGSKGRPNDIWTPQVYKIGEGPSIPVRVALGPKGYQTLTVTPKTPAPNGAYALVLDLGPHGRHFMTGYVRTFTANRQPARFPQLCLDNREVDLLTRLGAAPNRIGIGYKPTTDPDFADWYRQQGDTLMAYKAAGLGITVEFGGGAFRHENQPLGRMRPWLDEKGVMRDTKFDLAWLPSWDPDFRKVVKSFATDYGWPKGPIHSMKLWNEPWNGISISGWGADDFRYREIYTVMCEAVEEARQEAGVEILLGGCDSSSNTFDKLFGDGQDTFLKWLDFCSIHYQGMHPPSTVKAWVNRQHPNGRVRIWDTESWVANTDDRVATVVAVNLSTGHDRAVGIYHGNIADAREMYWQATDIFDGEGRKQRIQTGHTWSVAAAVGAATHFIGERRFKELLFTNGLPWVIVFHGTVDAQGKEDVEDATVVVVGDIGEAFGADHMLFRTARGLAEIRHKQKLAAQLAALPADAPAAERAALEKALATPRALSGAAMTLRDGRSQFRLFDFYGNPVPGKRGRIEVPLDHRGFFLRGNGRAGSFAALLKAIEESRVEGIEPLAKECLDLTARIDQRPTLRLRLTNVLNRPVAGKLSVRLGDLVLATPEQEVSFGAHETRVIAIPVTGGAANEQNAYPLSLHFDAGRDGVSEHQETLRVNVIARRTIAVDGKLDDWRDIPVQPVTSPAFAAPTLEESAWLPFKSFDKEIAKGYASGWLAYDDDNIYFAAKVADDTPDPGMVRLATRNDADYFYPEVSYEQTVAGGKDAQHFSVRWTGQVLAPETGAYRFITRSDDGVRLWVNGEPLIDNWTNHGATDDTGVITLQAGTRYDLTLEYFQGGGGGSLRLFWQTPKGEQRVILPTANLYPTPAAADAGTGLTGEYFRGTDLKTPVQTRLDPVIDFTAWPGTPDSPEFGRVVMVMKAHTWPVGVRRYSYRQDPDLPAGNSPNHDNVQIAFNVLSEDEKPWATTLPGAMPRYKGYWCTDYEYALNPVAERHGGGTEIWPLRRPDLPNKHYYPHSPKAENEGPVKGGKLVVIRDGHTRITECALPWAEIPHVKRALEEGRTIKFSFRVNDNAGAGCMELSRGRSVAKRNSSFKVDWVEHWANELEFAFER